MTTTVSSPGGIAYRAVLALAFALAAAGCGSTSAAEAGADPAAAPVRDTATLSPDAVRLAGLVVAPAESLPWRESWTVPARVILDPAATQSLGAIAEGRVTRVLARVGDRVAAGQVLAAIHSHEMMELRSDLAKASAAVTESDIALEVATSGLTRAGQLHALRALSLADLERARAALAQARARHVQARAELQRVRASRDHLVGAGRIPSGTDEHEVLVRSPVAGTVVALEARPGAVVLVGAPLVTVSRTTSLMLALDLPERAMGAASPGSTVRFTLPAFPRERFDARVTRIGPTVDSLTRTVAVQAQVAGSAQRLRAGMYATAALLGAEGVRTLVVPAAAVQSLEGDTVVVAARAQGGGAVLEAMRVRVGRRTAEHAEILAGLRPGTPVVVEGAAIARAEILRRRTGA